MDLTLPAPDGELHPLGDAPNPAAVYLAGLSEGSRRTMAQSLNHMAHLLGYEHAGVCPWHQIRFEHTAWLRSELMQHYAAATANKMLSALRQTLKAAWRLGQMPAEAYHRAADVASVKGHTPDAAAGRSLATGELGALLWVCLKDKTPAGVRDAALVALTYGLRRAEVAGLSMKDFDGRRIRVRGKGNKIRAVPIEGDVGLLLGKWLIVRNRVLGPTGPVFVRIRKGGNITPDQLTPAAIYYILNQRRQQAALEKFTPHDLRRTFAGDLLDLGVDLATVQHLMGHANANTTAGYDRRGERAKHEAMKKVTLPLPHDI